MIPHGTRIIDVHSAGITEDEQQLSVWVNLSDGGLACVRFELADIIARAHVIEEGTRAPDGMRLQ